MNRRTGRTGVHALVSVCRNHVLTVPRVLCSYHKLLVPRVQHFIYIPARLSYSHPSFLKLFLLFLFYSNFFYFSISIFIRTPDSFPVVWILCIPRLTIPQNKHLRCRYFSSATNTFFFTIKYLFIFFHRHVRSSVTFEL